MKTGHSIALLLSLIFASHLVASTNGAKVIYGEDNRVDVFESNNAAFVELSRSTAAMINSRYIKAEGEDFAIKASPMTARGVCASERFSNQMTAANCSGFLVAENILVTAGHCVRTEANCDHYQWVFDYKMESADQTDITVPSSSVYSCKRIIETKLDYYSKDDYAVIELDRPVTDRAVLNFRRSGKIAKGTELVIIGHPTGLPTKIADGASVRSHANKYFVANLDAFGGNSGSAVFNVKTSEVEGILVRGEKDFKYDPQQGCNVANHCPDTGCRGEDVTYITNIPYLNNL